MEKESATASGFKTQKAPGRVERFMNAIKDARDVLMNRKAPTIRGVGPDGKLVEIRVTDAVRAELRKSASESRPQRISAAQHGQAGRHARGERATDRSTSQGVAQRAHAPRHIPTKADLAPPIRPVVRSAQPSQQMGRSVPNL